MAHKLADEVLSMILASFLTISDGQFSTPSLVYWGSNDHISSSSLLLVCKKWLRVATPIMYEVIILRSTGQTHALADVFKKNSEFGKHVKKMRLEGAYSRLFEIFKRCPNLDSIFFALSDVMSADNVNAFCRSLPIINPRRFIFVDSEETDLLGNNAKKRRIFDAMCQFIPTWTKLREFHYPYKDDQSDMIPFYELYETKRGRLAKALMLSTTLDEVHSRTPHTWDPAWVKIASNDRIHFYFDVEPDAGESHFDHFLDRMAENPELKQKIHFAVAAGSSLSSKLQPLNSQELVPCFTPMALAPSDVTEKIWSRVFAFTLFLGHPEDTQVAIDSFQPNCHPYNTGNLISTRNTISLVCKEWRRLLQSLLIKTPLITSSEAYASFVKLVLGDPTIGSQVLLLSLDFMNEFTPENDLTLRDILPHLRKLRYFAGRHGYPISFAAFEALAEAAGNTLISIMNLEIQVYAAASPTVFNRFKCLEVLEAWSLPRLRYDVVLASAGCLSTVKDISFDDMSTCSSFFSSLPFPCLKRARFFKATSHELAFLESCGRQIDILEVKMWILLGPDDCAVDLLRSCSVLKTLVLGGMTCPRFLQISSGNRTVESILIHSACLGYPGDKHTAHIIDCFFELLPLERFPNIREIRILDYVWPVYHRDIGKDHLVRKASEIKEQFGVDLIDGSGKPFRPRAQSRRRRR